MGISLVYHKSSHLIRMKLLELKQEKKKRDRLRNDFLCSSRSTEFNKKLLKPH